MFKNEAEAAGYLAGMIDGEGCVSYVPEERRRAIRIVNTSRAILDACMAAYACLGIEAKLYTNGNPAQGRKQSWSVSIGGMENMRRLASYVQLRDPGKRERLEQAIQPSETQVERAAFRAELRRLRLEGLTHVEIGERLACSKNTSIRYASRLRGRKLLATDIPDIRMLIEQGWKQRDIAHAYDISEPHLSAIKKRQVWTAI